MSSEDDAVHLSQQGGFSSFVSRFVMAIQHFKPSVVMEQCKQIRASIIESNVLSVWLFLLAMPMLGIVIQCGLFLFGKPCSPYPMWISFLLFSLLSLMIHWKCLIQFWAFIFLGLFFTAYTFSYCGVDAELCHIPMQLLLKGGWNPIFDSTIPKISTLVDPSTLYVYHTLFMPKCIALCGALVAQSTGLWIANSFLGYLLFFILFRTAFVFAERNYKCNKTCSLLFATSISFCTQSWTLLDGLLDFHGYAALLIALFSLFLYLKQHNKQDFIMAIMSTAICCTTKLNGIANCILLWFVFGVFSWRNKETYRGVLIVLLLVFLIGMSPIITSWIQYGSPLYPAVTFDPRATTIDLTDDFFANADGERMGYLARFVYAWISPELMKKAAALYYHKADFNPVFNLQVTRGVGGFGKSLNILFFFSLVCIFAARKNMVSLIYFYIIATLFLCPVKYIGYERYFPQVWIALPLGFYQFCFFPPAWIEKKEKVNRYLRLGLLVVLFLFSLSIIAYFFAYQARDMIVEGKKQSFLASLQRDGVTFEIPRGSNKSYCLSQRLVCANVPYLFSEESIDMHNFKFGRHRNLSVEDSSYPQFTQYYLDYWNTLAEYDFTNNPSSLLRFKWLDVFKYFPHPLFSREPRVIESTATPTDSVDTPVFFHRD